MKLYRNSQKRIHRAEEIYFVTSKTKNNFSFFEEPIFCELFVEELKLCKRLKQFGLFAFALNYDHFHLVVKPKFEVANISEVMQFLKRHSSRNINLLPEGDIGQCRLRCTRVQIATPRSESRIDARADNWRSDFDQAFVLPLRDQFLTKHGRDQNKFPLFSWQRSFHDHVIRNPADFTHHIGYATWNHLKHKLPDNWKYTSRNFPELIDPSV